MSARRVRIGIDTGGTFTDVVAVDEDSGRIATTKTPSTPADPAEGFLNGVRKVLGASTGSIVQLLSTDFLKLVAIAACIAFPIAWYARYHWLSDFAYQIPIHWYVFLAAGFLAALIALATISFQAVRAALSNPVKALRSE